MARPSNMLSDPGLLEAALEGLLLQRDRIESQIREVKTLLSRKRGSNGTAGEPAVGASARKRHLSDAARRRIAAAQKKRWAEYRKQNKSE
jgi:hypothetical protein